MNLKEVLAKFSAVCCSLKSQILSSATRCLLANKTTFSMLLYHPALASVLPGVQIEAEGGGTSKHSNPGLQPTSGYLSARGSVEISAYTLRTVAAAPLPRIPSMGKDTICPCKSSAKVYACAALIAQDDTTA